MDVSAHAHCAIHEPYMPAKENSMEYHAQLRTSTEHVLQKMTGRASFLGAFLC
jgi:hypothetical protein